MKKTREISSVIGLLILAAFLDVTYQGIKPVDASTFQTNFATLFWLRIFSTLLITFLLLLLAWHLLCHSPRERAVTVACIIIGGLVLISATVPAAMFMGRFNLLRTTLGRWLTDIVSSDLSLTSHVAAFILAIGIVRLWRLPRK